MSYSGTMVSSYTRKFNQSGTLFEQLHSFRLFHRFFNRMSLELAFQSCKSVLLVPLKRYWLEKNYFSKEETKFQRRAVFLEETAGLRMFQAVFPSS